MIKRLSENKMLGCACGLLLMYAIVLYPIVVFAFKTNAGLSYIFTSLLFALPVFICAYLLPRKWMFSVLAILLTVISLVELTMVDIYDAYIMPGGIISTIRTDTQEASEFYNTNLKEVCRWMPLIILCVLACISYNRPKLSKRMWIVSAALVLLPIGFTGAKMAQYAHGHSAITLRYYLDNRVWNRPPYNIFYASHNAHKLLEQRRMIALAESMRFGAYRADTCMQKEIYVLGIGESLRYSNLSLNGVYARSTTPRLEAMEKLVLFDNYYSQACLTMFSVPMIITRATPTNFELNYAERSIIEPFRECGFHTFVISNTNLLSYETYLSNGCDSLYAIDNVVQNGEIISGDKTIVHIIDSLAQVYDKLFILCQFKGSHSFYTNYEPEFDVYHPNSNDPGVGYSRESLTNAYDNSILYTDYILSSIAKVLDMENTCSAMMFVSDHGEGIGDGGGGHGGDCSPEKEEYHVPFMFFWNDNYAATFSNKINAARSHKQSKINGDVIFYSVCSMANIEIDSAYAQQTYDVLSSDFQEHPRLILVPDGVSTVNPDK